MATQSQPVVINLSYAREIGDLLKAAREERHLSRAEVSDTLLCSVPQVEGLESGSARYFYGSRLFAQALSRYADLMALSLDRHQLVQSGDWLVGDVTTEDVSLEGASTAGAGAENPSDCFSRQQLQGAIAMPMAALRASASRHGRWAAVAVMVSAIALIAVVSLSDKTAAVQPAIAAAPVVTVPPAVPVAEPAPPALAPVSETAHGLNPIHLAFSGASWVQVRDAHGRSIERIYQKGESTDVDVADFSSLVVGNAVATSLTINDRLITADVLAPYTQGRVIRLSQKDIRGMVP